MSSTISISAPGGGLGGRGEAGDHLLLVAAVAGQVAQARVLGELDELGGLDVRPT